MKYFLKKILPWHIRQTLASARRFYAVRRPPFRGVYARFEEVPVTHAWRATHWAESSQRYAEKWRRQIGAVIPESAQPSKALLPVLTLALTAGVGRSSVRILDFGGAGGVDYAHLLAALGTNPGFDLRYHVVDVPESCEAGRRVWGDDPRISFSTELPEPSERFDVVYAFSAIYQVDDFRRVLGKFSEYHPSLMLFCKLPVYEGPSFVRRQVNMGKEMENPNWVFGIRDLEETLGKGGYVLTYRGYSEDSFNVDGYDEAHRVARTVNLVFSRAVAGGSDIS